MRWLLAILSSVALIVAVPACDDNGDGDADADADGDVGADGDGDADGDTDTDGDSDGDGDAGVDGDQDVPACPDGTCSPDEDAVSCPDDCPAVCGDGACTRGETAGSCYLDCGSCGDHRCTVGEEDASSCPADCPADCGDGACTRDEDIETCPEDCSVCPDGLCTGDENAGTCPADCPARCGDDACTDDEDACSCEDDCAPVCDDGCCTRGETAVSCYLDCGSCGDDMCTEGEEDASSCPADCPAVCGDEAVTHDEECDDGNETDGDGCDADCRFSCHGPEDCSDENDCTTDRCVDVPHGRACAHEAVSEGSACDDGTWCNGSDTCDDAAECTHHEGDPCTEVGTICTERDDRCDVLEWNEVIDGEEVRVDQEGSVQKGPFVIGSSVDVSVLDGDLFPTGFVYSTETINNRGEFEVRFTTRHPVALEGDGYYYNEVTGELSDSPLTLRALYGPPGGGVRSANINIVTHLTTRRIRALVSDGWPFGGAVVRAERELVSALNITPLSFVPDAAGVEMSLLGGDTDDNAFLLAVGSVLIQVALERGGGSLDATLQELLNTTALELEDGSLGAEAVEEVGVALSLLRTGEIEERLAERMAAIGSAATVPDLDRILDQDRDGVANADDCRPFDPAIHPGAEERCNNLDDDCDGIIPEDADGDGFHDAECGGDDCDDGDPEVHPGLVDACGDGVDSDCNGSDSISCFVTVTAGTFTMGSPSSEWYCWSEPGGELCAEEPRHEVTLTHDFEILSSEVTQAQFGEVMGYNPSSFSDCGPDCPVDHVSWDQAAAYCNALSDAVGLSPCYWCAGSGETPGCGVSPWYVSPYDCPGYRLPTEAEWEYAARAGTTATTYNGDLEPGLYVVDEGCAGEADSAVLDPIAWYCSNSDDRIHAVGRRRPNHWGLYDMLGNVWEWCHDGGGDYPEGPVSDPSYPTEGMAHMVRGGSYYDLARDVRAANRDWDLHGVGRCCGNGFRVARTLEP
jgi:formylglycine-generating enzyme required for sulfatase activity